MKKVEAIIRPERVNAVKDALVERGFVGLNTVPVTGRGAQRGIVHQGRSGQSLAIDMLPKTNMESVVSDADKVCDIIIEVARTGEIGAGKIFITSVDEVIRVRTEERGRPALERRLPPVRPLDQPAIPAPPAGRWRLRSPWAVRGWS
jgi:nitrogen regulatory protein P-II 1